MLDKLKIYGIISACMKFFEGLKNFLRDRVGRNLPLLKARCVKSYQAVMKKGSEHLTVMCIPHSEKKIITLHISNFTLFFGLMILILVIALSSLNIVSTSTTKQEVSNLIQLSKNWKIKEKLLRGEIDGVNDKMESLKPEIEKLYSYAASTKDKFINLFAQGGSTEPSGPAAATNLPSKLPDEFYDLQQIKNDIVLSRKYIEQIKNFINERESLFSKLPSVWPLKVGGYITSPYGWRKYPFGRHRSEWHKGLDIASWPGAPVIATADGSVIYAGWQSGYGLHLIVQHEYGFQTHYAHLSRIKAFVGKRVKKGDVIGFLGKSGTTTGYHLHYEVRIGMADVSPLPYIMNIK
jgi:murein DD-endopeptidase MepM/ murein hydrolase activator NlpD